VKRSCSALLLILAAMSQAAFASPRVPVERDAPTAPNAPIAPIAPDARDAVRTDPLATLQPAASMHEIGFPSHGSTMNGLIYLPGGTGPHPVVVFLHGYPGNERNLDLAQAVRRAGYAALYFDYRGAFGSGGTFTFGHSLEDAASVLAWVRAPENVAKYHLDPTRIAVFGHSFGGWLALASVAHGQPGVCVAAAAAWNPGWVAGRFAAHQNELTDALSYYQATTNATSGPIRANPYELIRDMHDHAKQWDYVSQASALKGHALLLIAGTADTPDEGVERETQLQQAIHEKGGNQVQLVSFDDDESFSSHRLALADSLVEWLRTDCAKTQAGQTNPK
jgi:dipeptidyl aminopeptidase/acylaminoacyl peptidase